MQRKLCKSSIRHPDAPAGLVYGEKPTFYSLYTYLDEALADVTGTQGFVAAGGQRQS